jgi:hypothetical protein
LNKIFSLKSNAIFLATLLFLGTIATILPSAHAQPYYEDNRYDPQYPSEYTNNNSYEKKSYRNDNYEPREYPPQYQEREYNNYKPSYEKNSYDTPPSYGNDNYQPREYSSYQQDYKQEYQSYEKDNNYKSKKDDSSKSASINKIKCINNNVNINGNNTGDINIGNNGQGYLGASWSGGNGYYDEGYGKQNKDFDCIINNNNNNIADGGNQTTPPKATLNVTKNVTCTYLVGGLTPEEACRLLEQRITENQFLIEVTNDNPVPSQFPGSESGTIVTLGAGNYVVSETFDVASLEADIAFLVAEFKRLAGGGGVRDYVITGPIVSFTGDCTAVNLGSEATGTIAAGESQNCEIENHFDIGLAPLIDEICNNQIDDDLDGLVDAGDPDCSLGTGGLTASNIITDTSLSSNINTAGSQAASFFSPPTIAQETEEGLSALEKITKLKTQWLDLLP